MGLQVTIELVPRTKNKCIMEIMLILLDTLLNVYIPSSVHTCCEKEQLLKYFCVLTRY